MSKELRVEQIATRIINQDQIGLQIKAVLLEREEGGESTGFTISNTTFEVRTGVEKVFEGQSDPETGIFLADITLDVNERPEIDIKITAGDEADRISSSTRLNISAIMIQHQDNIKDNRDLGDPEEQRKSKASIKKALSEKDLNVLVKHQRHPETVRGVWDIAMNDPGYIIEHVGCYKSAIWAAEIMAIAAMLKSKEALRKFPDYCELSWSKDIVLEIAKHRPEVAFSEIEYYEYQPWAKEVAEEAAKINPDAALKFFVLYRDQPWAEDVRELAEHVKDGGAKVKAVSKAEAGAEAARWTWNGLQTRVRSGDVQSVIANFHKYGHQPWSKNVLFEASGVNPLSTIKMFNHYSSASWAKDILFQAVHNSSPVTLLENISDIPEQWQEEVLEIAIDPGMDRLKHSIGHSHIKSGANYLIDYCSESIHRTVVEKIAKIVVRKYPMVAEIYGHYFGLRKEEK